jgi:hypothetical protein
VKKEEKIKYQEDSVLSKLISSVQAQPIEIPYYSSPSIWSTSRHFLLLTLASETQHLWLNSSAQHPATKVLTSYSPPLNICSAYNPLVFTTKLCWSPTNSRQLSPSFPIFEIHYSLSEASHLTLPTITFKILSFLTPKLPTCN